MSDFPSTESRDVAIIAAALKLTTTSGYNDHDEQLRQFLINYKAIGLAAKKHPSEFTVKEVLEEAKK